MIIKKFQGKTEEEAKELAKKELGDSIVVLSVKTIKPKWYQRLFQSSKVEVTVAKEEESETDAAKQNSDIVEAIASIHSLWEKSEAEQMKQSEKMKTSERMEPDDSLTDLSEDLQKELAGGSLKPEKTTFRMENDTDVFKSRKSGLRRGRDMDFRQSQDADPWQGNAPEKTPEELHFREYANATRCEKPSGDNENEEMINFLDLLKETMVDNEISEKYASPLIEEVKAMLKPNMEIEYVLSQIYQKMILQFGKPETITPAEKPGAKVVYFIGPTGVGKTTTLAKLASQLHLIDGKKIALFTADTYRISATDQLKTYANIMGVPLHIIYSVDEMLEVYENYKDYDYILVDTAGHSHHNDKQREAMNAFVHAFDDIAESDVYLVLSSTTKYRDLVSITDTYHEMTNYKIIFTKLDETTTYGNLLNIRIHTQAPLSYVTCGQNVPDDIARFDPQTTVKKLLSSTEDSF
ncbi:MAG: flagellar biosynthesis protein FlhF [Lachnospiraceae bacterium]